MRVWIVYLAQPCHFHLRDLFEVLLYLLDIEIVVELAVVNQENANSVQINATNPI